ncbi:hypothetical protein CDAR_68371 [Caerostris darwini]|uniref:Uncharacterized protein n=1 Tax=Caerostris darwini TaxID=1538125 RepID=A0AAV4QW93_9ARAC|nr:hypothetical protein CDAR_68371 [Caerostris darwini]
MAVSYLLPAYLVILFVSVSALPPWKRGWYPGGGIRRPGYDHDHDYGHGHGYDRHHRPDYPGRPGFQPDRCKYGRPCEDSSQQDYEDYDEQPNNLGCSCFLYVEKTVVFRRENNDQRYSCSGYGLRKCSRYCDELFQSEGLRASSRQDACDVLGREVYTEWYRKNQVCGRNGPQVDIPQESPLCCRRGRPSLTCSEEGTRST